MLESITHDTMHARESICMRSTEGVHAWTRPSCWLHAALLSLVLYRAGESRRLAQHRSDVRLGLAACQSPGPERKRGQRTV